MNNRTTYYTWDAWQAAYLDVMGLLLLECRFNAQGQAIWVFANEDDAAWLAAMEYRTSDTATVPAKQYKLSFRRMMDVRNAMREVNHGHSNYDAA